MRRIVSITNNNMLCKCNCYFIRCDMEQKAIYLLIIWNIVLGEAQANGDKNKEHMWGWGSMTPFNAPKRHLVCGSFEADAAPLLRARPKCKRRTILIRNGAQLDGCAQTASGQPLKWNQSIFEERDSIVLTAGHVCERMIVSCCCNSNIAIFHWFIWNKCDCILCMCQHFVTISIMCVCVCVCFCVLHFNSALNSGELLPLFLRNPYILHKWLL